MQLLEIVDIDDWEYVGRLVRLDDGKVKNGNESFYQVKTFSVEFDIVESEVKSIKEVELNSESLRLWEYIGKNVKVETNDGKVFEGRAIGVDDDDNESGYYSLNIETDKENDIVYDLNENEIESIKEIE